MAKPWQHHRARPTRLRYALPALEPPLRLAAYAWEAQPGRLSMTVSCELTLKLTHGAEAHFVEPAPFFDEVLRRTAEADFRVPFKPRADVLLVGHCYSPADDGEVDRLLLRMRIGEWAKAVRVSGDRFWLREGGRLVAGPPRKFRRILLSGDRAPRSPENPQGIDLEAVPIEHRIALPNLEPGSVGYSAVLGPVPANAVSRSGLVHPTAPVWVHALLSGHRAGPPPEGFNFGYFNLAPFDQQLPEIPVGAAVVLENVHPEHAIFTSRIPSVRPRAFVFDPQALQQLEIPLRCDTLWIDAEREIATMVFRGVIPISNPELATQVITKVETVERSAQPVSAPHMTQTQMGTDLVAGGLPFTKSSSHPSVQPTGAPPPEELRTARASMGPRPTVKLSSPPLPGGGFVTQEISVGPGLGALPFDARSLRHEDETTHSLSGDEPITATSSRSLEHRRPAPRLPEVVEEDLSDSPTPRPFATPETKSRATHLASTKLTPPDIGPTPAPPLPKRQLSVSEPPPISSTMMGPPPKAKSVAPDDEPRTLMRASQTNEAAAAPSDERTDEPRTLIAKDGDKSDEPKTLIATSTAKLLDTGPPPPVSMASLPLRPPPSPQLGALQLGTGKLASLALRPDKPSAAGSKPATSTAVPTGARPASGDTSARERSSAPPLVSSDHNGDSSHAIADPKTISLSASILAPPTAVQKTGSAVPNETAAYRAEPFDNSPTPQDTHAHQRRAPSEPPTLAKDEKAVVPILRKLEGDSTFTEDMTDSSTSDRRGIEARTLEEADADADRDAFEFPLPPSDGFEVDGVTLDHCAAIRAAIAMPSADRAAVLRKHQLDEATFARIEKTHLGRIDQETSNGAQDLLNRYDAAYVAAQDALRKPIGVKEYARIVTARKDGDIADVMSEMGVPRSELMRIDRVWKRRSAEYPEVDKTLKALIESLGKKR